MSDNTTDFGVLYSVYGEKFIAMAENSARSVKSVMPNCPVALFSDLGSDEEAVNFNFGKRELAEIELLKVDNLLRSPFEKTLLLDGDTHVIEPLEPLFELLDRFDLVVSHAPNRNPLDIEGIPVSFPELNCGVIGLRRNAKVEKFLRAWNENYVALGVKREQPSFRKTLYESDLSFFILTTEYNYRTNFPGAVGEGEKVRILHGKGNDNLALARKINKSTQARVSVLSIMDYFSSSILRIRPTSGVLKEFVIRLLNVLRNPFRRKT